MSWTQFCVNYINFLKMPRKNEKGIICEPQHKNAQPSFTTEPHKHTRMGSHRCLQETISGCKVGARFEKTKTQGNSFQNTKNHAASCCCWLYKWGTLLSQNVQTDLWVDVKIGSFRVRFEDISVWLGKRTCNSSVKMLTK